MNFCIIKLRINEFVINQIKIDTRVTKDNTFLYYLDLRNIHIIH